MRFPHGPGFGAFGGILQDIVAGLFFLACLAVVVGLLVILVRFLLVATKAAEIYVAKNSPAEPVAPVAATAPAAPTVTTTSPVVKAPATTTTPLAKSPTATTTRIRTPRTPPPV